MEHKEYKFRAVECVVVQGCYEVHQIDTDGETILLSFDDCREFSRDSAIRLVKDLKESYQMCLEYAIDLNE